MNGSLRFGVRYVEMGQLLSYTLTPDNPFPRSRQDSTLANFCSVIRRNVSRSIADSSGTPEKDAKSLNLAHLPPELAFDILSYLNATDLYLAACVWWNLASDEVLWQGLCRATWPYCSAYKTWTEQPNFSFRILFLRLDEARLTFNIDAFEGIKYLQKYEILSDETDDLAMFLHSAPGLDPVQKRRFLETRPDVLAGLIRIKNFHQQFLPNALRALLTEIPTPEKNASNFMAQIIQVFSEHFVRCNPSIGLPPDAVYIICFSLIMLSLDFSCPQIKNKMSKREFIRNTRRAALQASCDEFLGSLYDNVYLEGVIAKPSAAPTRSRRSKSSPTHRFPSPHRPFYVFR
nr:unnamed protein product [Spirometra erinaceieuropaei]